MVLIVRPVVLGLLALLAGCGAPSLLVTPVADVRGLQTVVLDEGRGLTRSRIALIEVEGLLLNARTGGFLQPQENKVSLFVEQLREAERDPRVRAVVLRINSPGGAVAAADTMHQAVLRFRQRSGKPVFASAQDVCASGGYYVACAADAIVAHPSGVVGSVGVIFQTFSVEGTLSKLGVRTEAVKSGRLKDLASPLHNLRDEERAVLQGMIDEYQARFLDVVREARSPASVEQVADGRVFTAAQARDAGLVDDLGFLEDVVEAARRHVGAPGAAVVAYRRPYGYRGSIYASAPAPTPHASPLIDLPENLQPLPGGFYYLWRP